MVKTKTKAAARKLPAKHNGHANHLCELVARRQMAKVGALSKDACCICFICGRASANPDNLCEPVSL